VKPKQIANRYRLPLAAEVAFWTGSLFTGLLLLGSAAYLVSHGAVSQSVICLCVYAFYFLAVTRPSCHIVREVQIADGRLQFKPILGRTMSIQNDDIAGARVVRGNRRTSGVDELVIETTDGRAVRVRGLVSGFDELVGRIVSPRADSSSSGRPQPPRTP
jgi:hypothetical protein